MKVRVSCPSCGVGLDVKAELIGTEGKCPGCGEVVTLRETDAASITISIPKPSKRVLGVSAFVGLLVIVIVVAFAIPEPRGLGFTLQDAYFALGTSTAFDLDFVTAENRANGLDESFARSKFTTVRLASAPRSKEVIECSVMIRLENIDDSDSDEIQRAMVAIAILTSLAVPELSQSESIDLYLNSRERVGNLGGRVENRKGGKVITYHKLANIDLLTIELASNDNS